MSVSLNLAGRFDLNLRIHWSLWLVVLWAGAEGWRWSNRWQGALFAILAIVLFFVCVLLHELGHVYAARRFDIAVDGVTLLPFGGVARIRYTPARPWPEFAIAVAGPLVNGAISVLLLGLLFVIWGPSLPIGFSQSTETVLPGILRSVFGGGSGLGLVAFLVLTNFLLAAFNLLPAFPLDGGRMLRAVLAIGLPYQTATVIAVRLGQVMAAVTIILTLTPYFGYQSLGLVFVSVFVFVGGTYEEKIVKTRDYLRRLKVADVVTLPDLTDVILISTEDKLGLIMTRVFKAPQFDLPVMVHDVLAGMLRRDDLLQALQAGQANLTVGDIMHTEFPVVLPTDSLQTVQHYMLATQFTTLPILEDGILVGLINIRDVNQASGTVRA